MADKILVSTTEMQATINRYNNAKQSVEEAFSHMQSAMDHLDNCWKGPGWAAFMAKWQLIYANISRTEQALEKAVTGLQNTISTMDEAEANVDSNTNALEIGKAADIF